MTDFSWYVVRGELIKINRQFEIQFIHEIPFEERFKIDRGWRSDIIAESWYAWDSIGNQKCFELNYSIELAEQFIPGIEVFRKFELEKHFAKPFCLRYITIPAEWFKKDTILLPDYIKEVYNIE